MPEEEIKRMWMPRWIVDEMLRDLTESELRVFLVYSRHANLEGESYPGNPLVAYKTGISIRSVQRAVKSLVTKGLLSKVSRGTGGRRVFTVYRVLSQTWIEYQRSGVMPDVPVSGRPESRSEPVSGDSGSASELGLSTNPATAVMVCGKLSTKGDTRASGYCGKLSTKGDTAVMEREPQIQKPCHPCRKTMTAEVVNHDRAMSTEVIKKKFFKRHGEGEGGNHDKGNRQKTATTGIKGIIKKMFRSVNSVCNSRTKADKMVRDLRRHLAEQKKPCVPVGA